MSMSSQEIQQTQTAEIAGFIAKTFDILKSDEFSKIIYWTHSGEQFIIKDILKFQTIVLPKFFRHNKINSFIRQLNMYGFHKSRTEHSKSVFNHPAFLRNREDLLASIKRKIKGRPEPYETPVKRRLVVQLGTTATKSAVQTGNELTSIKNIMAELPNNGFSNMFGTKEKIHSLLNINFSANMLPQADMGFMKFEEESDHDECVSIEHKIQGEPAQTEGQRDGLSYKFMNPSCFFESMKKNTDI